MDKGLRVGTNENESPKSYRKLLSKSSAGVEKLYKDIRYKAYSHRQDL